MKKVLSIILSLVMLLTMLPTFALTAFAADIASGSGWRIDSEGCLHLTGAITNTSTVNSSGTYSVQTPWKNYRDSIKKIVAEAGSSVNNGICLFQNCKYATEIDISKLNTSAVNSAYGMFNSCDCITEIDLRSNNFSNATLLNFMFFECDNLERVYMPTTTCSKITNMHSMFNFCSKLKSVNFGGIDTSKVTDMSFLFANCTALESLDLSRFNTSSVETMQDMFWNCSSLISLDLSSFNTSKVKTMEEMFYQCGKLKTLNISNFSTESLTTTSYMINSCNHIEDISLNGNIIQKFAYTLINIHLKWINKSNSNVYSGETALKSITGKVTLSRAYDIIVGVEGNGTVTKSHTAAAKGQQVTLTPNPAVDYVFDKWESTDVTISGNKFTMPANNVTVKAVFKFSHTPVLVPSKPATNDEDGYKDYYSCACGKLFEDEECTVEITDLDHWKSEFGNGHLEHFSHKVFTVLNLKPGETHIGDITVSPADGPYLPGTVITLSATPAEGYHHTGYWGEFGISTGLVITGNTFVMPDYDVFIGTSFEKHTWGEGTVITPAGCTTTGVMKYTCACGATKTEPIDAIGHNFVSYTYNNNATCTADGTETSKCTRCSATNTRAKAGSKLGHSFTTYKSNGDATCTADGTKTATCANGCGTKKTVTDKDSKSGHKTATTVKKATTSKNGSKVTKCTVCGKQTAKSTIYYPKKITISKTEYVYDGKAKKPTVTVKDSKDKKIASSNYTVKYSDNKKVGKATVKITFKGNYSGTVSKTFTIAPQPTEITSITPKSKGFTVNYKLLQSEITGYEVQYATDSKFTKGVESYTISKDLVASKQKTKMKGKTKYFVRVRTYKTVGSKTYYSTWSKTKSVTTKA